MKRSIFCFIIVLILLSALLISCGGTERETDASETGESTLATTEATGAMTEEEQTVHGSESFATGESTTEEMTEKVTEKATEQVSEQVTEKETETKVIEDVFDLVDFVVSVPADREPVILQITDTQLIDGSQCRTEDRIGASAQVFWGPDRRDEECYDYIRETVEAVKPDLILLTGDIIYGEFDDNGENFASIVEFMDSFDIPWAPIFGNHEAESKKGVDWQCAQLESAKNCLFVQRELTGNGNYTVGIEQGGELTRVFFMLDSNGCNGASAESLANAHFKMSSGFANDQIRWYTDCINEIKKMSPDTKLSFAFHIQLAVVVDAFEKYADENGTAHIDRLNSKSEGDFGYISDNRNLGWDQGYVVWEGLKELGVDSIFFGHVHTHSASIVYEGIRLQFGMKSSTYDSSNFVDASGNIKSGYHLSGLTPLIGGSVLTLSPTGEISDAYIYYCKNAGGDIDWDSFGKIESDKPADDGSCKHTENTAEYVAVEGDIQREQSVCSLCGETVIRFKNLTEEGLHLFNCQQIASKTGKNAKVLNDGPGGMSYVRINSTAELGNEFILLQADTKNLITNLGSYVAILYRTTVEQKLMFACDSTSSVQRAGVQKLSTHDYGGQWDFVVHENKTHDLYDGENLSAFAFYQFAAGINRTLDDYTDIAFIGFFSSAEEAWEFFDLYKEAYGFAFGEDFATHYYIDLNGNTEIDGVDLIKAGGHDKAHTVDCTGKVLSTPTSLQIGGWCATPGGIASYGYYVVSDGIKSDLKPLANGTDSTSILTQTPILLYPASCGKGIIMGTQTLDLSGYEGKTVTVLLVATTLWGDEISLATFQNVQIS